jgi:23S rRNA pseudouridine2605 synthase
MLERIQKIISAAGVTSRRAAEELIAEGRVRVNGQVVTELGTKADADKDHIKVDGKLINPQQPKIYVMLNKPAGFVTTMSDPEGRPTVQDLLKGVKIRIYPVGRLDYNTEGMLILTNDGDFAHLITHPKHEFPKTYLAKVKGFLEDSQIENLEQGIYLDDGKTAPAKLKKVRKEEANSWLEITIHEGRKRQVRRMFDRVGHSVIKLKRIRTGGLVLGDLAEGSFRYLTSDEVSGLREMAQKTGFSGQEPGVRSQKASVRPQRAVNTGKDQPRMMNERGTKKPAHRGAQPDARPWRAVHTDRDERRPTGARGARPASRGARTDARPGRAEFGKKEGTGARGVMSGAGRPAFGKRSKADVGRVRIPAMQDTSDGRRKNQVVDSTFPQQKSSFENPRTAASGSPRGDSAYRPASRPATSRPPMRTGIGRPATGAAMGNPETRRKPDQRPWPGTRKSGPRSKGPGEASSYVPRRDSSARPATRSAMGRPAARAGFGRPSTGAAMRQPEGGRKPAPRSWSGSGSNDSRRKGTGYEGRSEGRRPSSGPRPNRSTHAGKGPGRGKGPVTRGPGRGASNRGPRR